MREILFRGKRHNGEWYYGSYLFLNVPDRDWKGDTRGKPEPVHYIINEKDINYAVDPETVGQYTGLTDKNGKKIFEGDILHVVSYTCDYDFKTSVGAKYGFTSGLYVDGYFDGGDFNEIGFAFEYWSEEDAEVEVIGSIHDNPELLEE